MPLLGFAVGVTAGWFARSMVAVLEATGHLPSVEDALRVLDPVWCAWDEQVVA